ncbi:winged helix-turn-helix transcriptional regulator [Natronomonas sp.]|uniref:winged helix-turn-helix transcriptional regulator n=1 Tax=Natronomonas sp. TaxID=2184060 RepID=UPI003975A07F
MDRRIICRLTENARHISAPQIAKEVGVSAPTSRNEFVGSKTRESPKGITPRSIRRNWIGD